MKKILFALGVFFFSAVSTASAFEGTPELDAKIDRAVDRVVNLVSERGDDYKMNLFKVLDRLEEKHANKRAVVYVIEQLRMKVKARLTMMMEGTMFMVKIENISADSSLGTPFAPGVFAVHPSDSMPLFMEGQSAMYGLEELAEDGNAGILADYLMGLDKMKVKKSGVFSMPDGGEEAGPAFPGSSYMFEFNAIPGDMLNFATMLVQSNDMFVAADDMGIALFDDAGMPIEGDITDMFMLRDAGTEVNEEPGVGINQAPRQSGPDTGMEEYGKVHLENDPWTYPAVNEMLKITIMKK